MEQQQEREILLPLHDQRELTPEETIRLLRLQMVDYQKMIIRKNKEIRAVLESNDALKMDLSLKQRAFEKRVCELRKENKVLQEALAEFK